MFKSLVFLSALATSALAYYQVSVENNYSRNIHLYAQDGTRQCYCLTNTQSAYIRGVNGGDIKLFSSDDCTGSYSTLESDEEVGEAHWVNSVSFGASGSSKDPNGYCPNWHTAH
ncbi:hypothetical protein BG005_007627 [Podila minutissima]|nr:hypothetical protein BG005_007627 [Podila minutissima]